MSFFSHSLPFRTPNLAPQSVFQNWVSSQNGNVYPSTCSVCISLYFRLLRRRYGETTGRRDISNVHSSVSMTPTPKRMINLSSHSHSLNPRFCPDPYCVCTRLTTDTISSTVTTDSIVNVYAATSGATVCPTAGAAVSEAGCQIVVMSKSDSTCGTVVFNTEFCPPSSMTSTISSTTPVQISSASQAPGQESQPMATISASAPTITAGPSYTTLYVTHLPELPQTRVSLPKKKKIKQILWQ